APTRAMAPACILSPICWIAAPSSAKAALSSVQTTRPTASPTASWCVSSSGCTRPPWPISFRGACAGIMAGFGVMAGRRRNHCMRIMISAPRARLLVALLLCAISVPVFAAATDSFTATYKAKYGIIGLGTLKFQLKPDPDAPGCYIYTGEGAPNAVVSMLVGDLSDASHFCITDDGTLQPQY